MKHAFQILTFLLVPGALAACDDLPALKRDVCGNTIIERGEDCDGAGLGANACNQLCRLECTPQGACPAGWGCGQDGLCRQPSGGFVSAGNSLAVSADRLSLADIDGDGGKDVLASRSGGLTVAFADPGGLSPETSHFTFATADAFPDVPSAGDLDGDGRADIALRVGGSIGVLHGQRDRSLTPQVFSRRLAIPGGDYLLTAMNADSRPEAPGDELFALGETGITLAHSANDGDFPAQPLLTWPAGEPILLQRYSGLTYGFEGRGDVHVFLPMASDPMTGDPVWNIGGGLSPPVTASLPSGATVQQGVFALALPWSLDMAATSTGTALLLGGEAAGQSGLYMSFLVAGGLHSRPFLADGEVADGLFAELGRTGAKGVGDEPLAVLELDDDDGPEIFTKAGYFTSACPLPGGGELCTLAYSSTPPSPAPSIEYELSEGADPGDAWTGVFSIGAGLYDSPASTYYSDLLVTTAKPGFLLLRNLHNPQLAKTFRVPTSSPVKHVITGDFNGDGSRDIGFAQPSRRAKQGDPPLDSVHVAWGDELGFPTPPVDLGDVGEVTQLVSARLFPTPSGKSAIVPRGDGVTDFVVRARRDGETFTYVFAGSTDRQLQSPLDLGTACDDGGAPAGVPRFSALLARNVVKEAELAVVYRTESADGTFAYDLWSFRPDSSDSEAICASLAGPTALPDPGGPALSMTPLDLEGDGQSEILLFAEGSSTLLVARRAEGGWSIDDLDLGAAYRGLFTTPLFTAGAEDLTDVVLWSDTAVTVLRNDGSGALDPARSTTLSLEGATCPGPAGAVPIGPVTGVTAVHLHPDEGRELLVLTEGLALLAEIEDAASGTLAAPECSQILGGGGTAVASGDVDGDGVEDVVIARPGGVQLLTGIPVVQ